MSVGLVFSPTDSPPPAALAPPKGTDQLFVSEAPNRNETYETVKSFRITRQGHVGTTNCGILLAVHRGVRTPAERREKRPAQEPPGPVRPSSPRRQPRGTAPSSARVLTPGRVAEACVDQRAVAPVARPACRNRRWWQSVALTTAKSFALAEVETYPLPSTRIRKV